MKCGKSAVCAHYNNIKHITDTALFWQDWLIGTRHTHCVGRACTHTHTYTVTRTGGTQKHTSHTLGQPRSATLAAAVFLCDSCGDKRTQAPLLARCGDCSQLNRFLSFFSSIPSLLPRTFTVLTQRGQLTVNTEVARVWRDEGEEGGPGFKETPEKRNTWEILQKCRNHARGTDCEDIKQPDEQTDWDRTHGRTGSEFLSVNLVF